MLIKNYKFNGGKHSETAAIKNILHNLGITSKFNNLPYTEDFLLGIGGGIRSSYFIFEIKNGPLLAIGARHLLESNNFLQDVCRRLRVPAILKESTSKKLAFTDLTSSLEEGFPVLAWTDLASLPYYHYPKDMIRYFIHVIIITGYDEKTKRFIIDDRSLIPIRLKAEVLEEARAVISSYKNRLLIPKTPLHSPNLKNAIIEGIKQCCDSMMHPKLKNFGLESLKEWAYGLTSNDSRHSWINIFGNKGDLYMALINVFHFIVTATDGAALRKMYFEFLLNADEIIPGKGFKESAQQFNEIAPMWIKLANTSLDDSIPLLRETKELLLQRNHLFSETGTKASTDLKQISKKIFQNKKEAAVNFPLTNSDTLDLLNEMKKIILDIHAKEKIAIETLSKKIAG